MAGTHSVWVTWREQEGRGSERGGGARGEGEGRGVQYIPGILSELLLEHLIITGWLKNHQTHSRCIYHL